MTNQTIKTQTIKTDGYFDAVDVVSKTALIHKGGVDIAGRAPPVYKVTQNTADVTVYEKECKAV